MQKTFDIEEWRSIQGYEGLYEVSNRGRVRSLPRKDFAGRRLKGRILAPGTKSNGYLSVNLSFGEKKNIHIHDLVTSAFLGKKPKGHEVNHIDYDRSNNRVENLEYVTHSENVLHSIDNIRMGKILAEPIERRLAVKATIDLYLQDVALSEIAKRTGRNLSSVYRILYRTGLRIRTVRKKTSR